jgi:hypothetical protein
MRHAHNQKIGKPNDKKTLAANNPRDLTRIAKNQLRSPMPEGGRRTLVLSIIILFWNCKFQ